MRNGAFRLWTHSCFEGGSTNQTGHISAALLPNGLSIPPEAQYVIDQLSKYPEERVHKGPIKKGAHVSWIPDVLSQLWLRELSDAAEGQLKPPYIVFAFKAPPSENAQPPQFTLYTYANAEFENYEEIYSAQPCNNAGMLMQAVTDTWGACKPCSENPNHLKNIAANVRKIVNDPTVRMLGGLALKAGKTLLPTVLEGVSNIAFM